MTLEIPETFLYFAMMNFDVAEGSVAIAVFRCAEAHRRGVTILLGSFSMFLLQVVDCC